VRKLATLLSTQIPYFQRNMFKTKIYFLASILTAAVICSPLLGQTVNPYQSRNQHFGVSGGNANDIGHAFCCGGTLGSLLTDGTTQYILSNNHVLARQDQAAVGEDISQPGLIDNHCQPATIVADYTAAPPLGSNVDAAIAQLIPGQMDSTGFIEGIGTISSTVAAPAVGLAVIKSGRTTGTTTGSIASVNTSVKVQYQVGCAEGKKYFINYTNQVLINSTTFSAGGDSGSLIVSNDTNFNPVALLFAGSSSTTIANPVGEVLTKVGTALGKSVSFVGGHGGGPGHGKPNSGNRIVGLPDQAVEHASRVLEQNRHDLMSKSGVLGVGLGGADNANSQAAIMVYVDKTNSNKPQLADQIDNVRLKVLLTDPFIAF
jgi:hypothetical protein